MAKDTTKNTNKDVATDKNPTQEVAGTVQPETQKDQIDNKEVQAPSVSTASGEAGSVASGDSAQGGGDSTSASGGENPEMDTQTENKGAGEQGGDAESQLKEPTKADKDRARIAGEVFEKNPNKANVLYFAGMIPFWNESDAERHAKSLADKTIVTITKQQ